MEGWVETGAGLAVFAQGTHKVQADSSRHITGV